ncbi:Protein of unknown function [Pyronema omphalodes CBS 100304]|uniref:Uncharacterized protein n=1 Tax=Pyronema omphalodes (strain CBS 100304) TaxID=1076935 RepID=U4LMP1_PYROM|nr:Protein of unknown function [Pyronema omphalodes CBS 100304]
MMIVSEISEPCDLLPILLRRRGELLNVMRVVYHDFTWRRRALTTLLVRLLVASFDMRRTT